MLAVMRRGGLFAGLIAYFVALAMFGVFAMTAQETGVVVGAVFALPIFTAGLVIHILWLMSLYVRVGDHEEH